MPTVSLDPASILIQGGQIVVSSSQDATDGDNTLYMGGTKYDTLKATACTIEGNLSSGYQMDVSLEYATGEPIPDLEQEVARFIDGMKRFGGVVIEIKESSKPGHVDQSILAIKCTGFQKYLEDVTINKDYAAGMSAAAMVSDLWSTYLTQKGVTYTPTGDPGVTLGEQAFKSVTLKQAFESILDQTPGWNLWIDHDKRLRYKQTSGGSPPVSADAPFALSRGSTATSADSMSRTLTNKRFVNRVKVIGDADQVAVQEDIFQGDERGFYNTKYPIGDTPPLGYWLFSGDPPGLGVLKASTKSTDPLDPPVGQYWGIVYTPGSNFIRAIQPDGPIHGGEVLTVRYATSTQAAGGLAEDADSIAAIGPVEIVIQAPGVSDTDTLNAIAAGVLALYGVPQERIDYAYNNGQQDEWLEPGMIQEALWTRPDFEGNYVVEQVRSEMQGRTMWRHTVVLRSGPGDVTDNRTYTELYRNKLSGVQSKDPNRITLDVDLLNAGVEIGPLPISWTADSDGVFTYWDALWRENPPTGAAIKIDAKLNGVSIFPSGSEITAADGVTTQQFGYQFTSANLPFKKNDVVTFEVLQIGSTIAGKYGLVHIGIKRKPVSN
jgi:hypothetical protein